MKNDDDNDADDPLFWKVLKSPHKKRIDWVFEKFIAQEKMRKIAEKNKNGKQ